MTTCRFLCRIGVLVWALLALNASAGPRAASAAAQAPPPATVFTSTVAATEVDGGRQPLDTAAWVLEDSTGTLDLAAVRAVPAERWTAPQAGPLSIGYSHSTFWARIRLTAPRRSEPIQRLFEVGSAVQDHVEVFVVRSSGAVQSFPDIGDCAPFTNRPVRSVTPVVPVALQPGETIELYLRLGSQDGIYEVLPLTLWEAPAFHEAAQWHWLSSGIYVGVLGIMLVYILFLLVANRLPTFGLYAGYIAAALVWHAAFSGDGLYLLWPETPALNNRLRPPGIGFWFGFGAPFVAHYLRLGRHLPRVHAVLLLVGSACAATSLIAVFDHYALALMLCIPLALAWWAGILWCGAVLWRRGVGEGLWLMMSWLPLLVCVVLHLAQWAGLSSVKVTPLMLQASIAAQIVLMGIGLADTTNRWRKDKFAAERQSRLAQQTAAERLEEDVRQRTRELQEANRRLQDLAITDALTGAFNRRHFNDVLKTEIQRLHREGSMPSLCLVDIDHFKSYNDLYGHHKGDSALKAVAAVLRQAMRRPGDSVFRVGGEEFALLMLPGDPQLQQRHVDGLRRAIEQLRIPHAGSAGGVVTASFGLVQMPPGDRLDAVTPASLFKEADRLLYAAKKAGRNRVMVDERPVEEWPASTDFIEQV